MPVSFKVDLSRVIEGLDKEKENAGKVIQRTMSDLYTRAPGWINKEIRKEYSMSGVAPHEKWTAVYSFVDKCRLVCGQDSGVNRTGLLQ